MMNAVLTCPSVPTEMVGWITVTLPYVEMASFLPVSLPHNVILKFIQTFFNQAYFQNLAPE